MLSSFPLAFLGGPEMVGVLILLILLFGAKKLPALARGVGESIGEFKKARKEIDAQDEEDAKKLPESEDKPAS